MTHQYGIKMHNYHTFTLPCGLRVILSPCPSQAVYCGIAVDAGTRDEGDKESGLAHFTEHMSFKGTTRRRSWHISQRMEAVGGDLNAFTGKEETVYYATSPKAYVARAIDVLFDVVLHSTYPQAEMDKEVEVVVAEIESYNDSPAELIYDEFEERLFRGHPLGRNILGQETDLRQHRTADMQRFVRRNYHLSDMTFFLQGDVPESQVLRLLERAVDGCVDSGLHRPERQGLSDVPYVPFCDTLQCDTHQRHVMLGGRGLGGGDPHHLALFFLNNILGGPAMSSRLNQLLRERHGLVYTVESTLTTYTDTGVWAVYFGCAPEDLKRCLRLTHGAIQQLVDAPLTPLQLSRAKQQLLGQLEISHDGYENNAIAMGKRFLHYNRTLSPSELNERIAALTAEELLSTAQLVFDPSRLSTLVME